MDNDNNNIFTLVAQANSQEAKPSIPEYDYEILNRDGQSFIHRGFMLFTSQHIAIMRETDVGALPIFVIPLDQVAFAEIIEDDEEV